MSYTALRARGAAFAGRAAAARSMGEDALMILCKHACVTSRVCRGRGSNPEVISSVQNELGQNRSIRISRRVLTEVNLEDDRVLDQKVDFLDVAVSR
jgi:hypothetical protein